MKQRRSRLALLGVMALALCVTLGLMVGAADAKKGKGKKKKSPHQVTAAVATPTPIPAGDGTNEVAGVASVALNVGKKAKGKVVNANNLFVTYQLSDPGGFLDDIDLKLVAPNGRAIFLDNPAGFFGDGDTLTVVGPLTTTPNSSVGYCFPNPAPPPAGCPDGDPDNNLAPPFAGVARDFDLANFAGVPARGTWTMKALNFSTVSTHVLDSAKIQLGLVAKPK
jgi:hypothetical protein